MFASVRVPVCSFHASPQKHCRTRVSHKRLAKRRRRIIALWTFLRAQTRRKHIDIGAAKATTTAAASAIKYRNHNWTMIRSVPESRISFRLSFFACHVERKFTIIGSDKKREVIQFSGVCMSLAYCVAWHNRFDRMERTLSCNSGEYKFRSRVIIESFAKIVIRFDSSSLAHIYISRSQLWFIIY